jgi:hypothetical protein
MDLSSSAQGKNLVALSGQRKKASEAAAVARGVSIPIDQKRILV